MRRKLAIVDHVGIKSGMDCYDLGLLRAMERQGFKTYLFSNINVLNQSGLKTYNFFESKKHFKIYTLINFIWAHLYAYTMCKTLGVKKIILHLFCTTRKEWFQYRLASIFGLKIITIVHDVDGFLNQDDQKFKSFIYGSSEYLIVHNQFSFQCISQYLSAFDKLKVRVIPHGNYLDFIRNNIPRELARQQLGLDLQKKYLLFFGQIKKVKGLELAIRALGELPEDVHLIIAGRPQHFDYQLITELISALNLQGRIHEQIRFIPNKERDLFFQAADMLVLPYLQIYQSGVLLMAMSHGLPIVASDLPANQEVIESGKNGQLFLTEDYIDLSRKIIKCIYDDGLLNHFRLASLETVRDRYAWDRIATEYIKFT